MTGMEFHKKLKIRSGVLAVVLISAFIATFMVNVFGFVKLGVIILGFFGYLWVLYSTLEFMVREGEDELVDLYLRKENWGIDDQMEWKALQSIYNLCAPISSMMPRETGEYQLHRAAVIASECRKQAEDA